MRWLVIPAPRDPRRVLHVVATGTMAHRPFTLAQHALAPGLRAAAARYLVNDKQTGIDPFQGDGKRLLDGSLFAPGGVLLIRGRGRGRRMAVAQWRRGLV
jgi:hypothetical protein